MSEPLRKILEAHWVRLIQKDSEDLVFTTPTGTPLSSKNLYNRVLAPACDRIKEPRVSWHSFRHAHATLLAESGESMKTAQPCWGTPISKRRSTSTRTPFQHRNGAQWRGCQRLCSQLFSSWAKTNRKENLTSCIQGG